MTPQSLHPQKPVTTWNQQIYTSTGTFRGRSMHASTPQQKSFGSQLPSKVPTRGNLGARIGQTGRRNLCILYFCTGWLAEHWPGGGQTLAQWPPDLLDLLYTHTLQYNAVTLVWDSLRLSPQTGTMQSR